MTVACSQKMKKNKIMFQELNFKKPQSKNGWIWLAVWLAGSEFYLHVWQIVVDK
jgi:hypothetical protein